VSGEAVEKLDALLAEPGAASLLAALEVAGEKARIVGGAVRNALMGIEFSDIDITTTALPQAVMRIAQNKGWKAIPTGIEHGTVTVVMEGRPYEVTTLREDVATDGRHAEVRFGHDFRADAARRDFTINAMSVGRDGVLHDEFGGLADLAARRVRSMPLGLLMLRDWRRSCAIVTGFRGSRASASGPRCSSSSWPRARST
jgi:poly(A) polymerase